MSRPRVAIVLFNLGGPDRPESIHPFLLNLFTDPAILRVPFFVRPILARIIARARVKPATANYALLGGRSPLLDLTKEQAAAVERALPEIDARCFIAMRYWHPFSDETALAVKAWDPDEIVLLPLYPHFSTTTTGSSLIAWHEAAARAGLIRRTVSLCCYHSDTDFVGATAALVRRGYEKAVTELAGGHPLRVLFSAHGLPEKIIREGDPYQFQIERTVAEIIETLDVSGLDAVVCYQSRATPQKWIGPSTEEELERAARDGCAVLVVPVAFVSEHSETLVELDVEYRELAHELGIPAYFRVPTQNADPMFINALAELVRRARRFGPGIWSHARSRTCPASASSCLCALGAAVDAPAEIVAAK